MIYTKKLEVGPPVIVWESYQKGDNYDWDEFYPFGPKNVFKCSEEGSGSILYRAFRYVNPTERTILIFFYPGVYALWMIEMTTLEQYFINLMLETNTALLTFPEDF